MRLASSTARLIGNLELMKYDPSVCLSTPFPDKIKSVSVCKLLLLDCYSRLQQLRHSVVGTAR